MRGYKCTFHVDSLTSMWITFGAGGIERRYRDDQF